MDFSVILHIVVLLFGTATFAAGVLSVYNRIRTWNLFWFRHGEKFDYHPKASVLLAVRGFDKKIGDTIKSLASQDYQNKYEVIISVDDDKNAYEHIRSLTKRYKNFRILLAPAPVASSGKASALLLAIKKARHDVLAFCDSDEILPHNWLQSIVGPLSEKGVGAATGYRVYIPRDGLRSAVVSAWNTIGFMFEMWKPYVIGGSYATRKSTMIKAGVLKKWEHTLSEDSDVTEQMNKHGLKIKFVPSAVVHSEYSNDFSHITEFTTRQMVIIRYYWKSLWKTTLAVFLFGRITTVLGFALLYLYFTNSSLLFFLEGIMLLWPMALGLPKASMDFYNLRKLTGHDIGPRYKYLLGDIAAQWLMTYNAVKAGFVSRIKWRGRLYTLKSAHDMTVEEIG